MSADDLSKQAEPPDSGNDGFSRREREIMDALYRLGKATAAEIRDHIPHPPSYTAIRTHLSILERKGHVRHTSDGVRYIFEPQIAREQMGRRAIDSLLQTFFDNSVERAVTALLTREDANIPREDLDRLAHLIEKAKREGR
ncbi:MAG TPA: BlaI/MecI/CopY family transcriptional regulator [Rhizomicrobium sp.]|jgi:predicted transcriptional regulator